MEANKLTTIAVHSDTKKKIEDRMQGRETYEACILRVFAIVDNFESYKRRGYSVYS